MSEKKILEELALDMQRWTKRLQDAVDGLINDLKDYKDEDERESSGEKDS